MVEEVTYLKNDFNQKENKYLEEFLDMKALKEKVEDKLYKQDQSLQTVHMLCKPKPNYNEQNKVAISYKNPLCLTHTKLVQPALYNGYEIIKNNHVPALVNNTEDTLEIAEITRRKMNDKMKDPECVTNKVKIAPPDYSKENYLATFTPQKQLTPEQIFWSQDLIKMKEEALKKQTTASRPIKALMVYPPNTPATLVPTVLPTKKVFYVATNSELNVSRFTEMHDAHTIVEARCPKLEAELSNLRDKIQKDNHNELVKRFSNLEITRAKHIEQTTVLLTENENLKAQIHENLKCNTIESVKPRVLAPSSTCPKAFNQRDKKQAPTSLIRKKQVTFDEQCNTSNSNTHKHVKQQNTQKTNVPVPPSTGVNFCTNASESQPRSNTKKNRISPAKGINKKKVEEHHRINKSNLRTMNHVDSSSSSKRTVINSNSDSICQTCNKCLIYANHDVCVVDYLQSVKASHSIHNIYNVVRKVKQVWKPKQVRQVWKLTDKVLTSIGHQWRPTGRIFTLREQCPLTRLTKPKVVQIVLWYLDSGCSKHMTGDRSRLRNFMKKFIGTVRFGNDHFGAIIGYGDYVISDSVISRVYYMEGLGHNLFSVGQFCDSDLEVVFRKHSCYVRDTDGVELIKGSRGSNLYTISVEDMMNSSPICLLSKASKNKSWLWHRRLNHLNFGTINDLARKDLVKFLRSKDETPEVVIKFLKQIQVGLNKTIRYICIDNGTEFVNKDLTEYYEHVGILHQKTVPRTPQQNGVVERWNRTLVEAARTMLIFSKAPMFLWTEAVATACYTQNRSFIHTRHNKTPYELVHDKKHDLTFFRVFGALCYPTNDSEDLGKLQPTVDIGIFVGYAPSRKGTGPAPTFLTPRQISSGLVPNPVPATPYVPSTNKELEILFQSMFDEYMEPPRVERLVSPAPTVLVPINSAGTPSSTTIDQDAPSPSYSQSSSALQSLSLHQGVAAESTLMEDNPFAPVDNHPFINVFAPEPSSEASSSGDLSSSESPYVSQTLHHLGK
ncbi:retrovirus-related pol polyprotein from transposon TNT 1-94 [Tanacetum coccineum]